MPRRGKAESSASVEPRKRPQQERSQEMVGRILDAARLILTENGTGGLTTIAIGERAGLSVGSLYQYFPNKEAIVLELARRWLAAFRAVMAGQRAAPPPRDRAEFERSVASFNGTVAEIYRENRSLLPVLDAMQANEALRRIDDEHNAAIIAEFGGWLAGINPALDPQVGERLGLVILEASHACFTAAAGFEAAQFDAVKADLDTMIVALLRPHLGLG